MVRQEDGKKIHQQREESQETQAEDDGRSSAAQTALITARGEEPGQGPISLSGGGTEAAFMSVIGLLFLASSVAAVDAVVGGNAGIVGAAGVGFVAVCFLVLLLLIVLFMLFLVLLVLFVVKLMSMLVLLSVVVLWVFFVGLLFLVWLFLE